MRCASLIEIIHCCEIIIVRYHFMHRDGMGNLNGGINILNWVNRQHTAIHCNICRSFWTNSNHSIECFTQIFQCSCLIFLRLSLFGLFIMFHKLFELIGQPASFWIDKINFKLLRYIYKCIDLEI